MIYTNARWCWFYKEVCIPGTTRVKDMEEDAGWRWKWKWRNSWGCWGWEQNVLHLKEGKVRDGGRGVCPVRKGWF
jgi:hypothetical protein